MEYTTLSPLAMFVNAGPVGKFVMLTLVLASVYTWVLIVLGVFSVLKIGKATRSARAGGDVGVLAPVDAAGRSAASWDLPGESIGEKRERIAEVMSRTAREFLAKEEGGLPNLAVISSVAPFIGLFGTVWGIMSSFAGIAQSQDTSLAVVAPGIAEALAATAYGLAAAIPASVGYNRIGAAFSRVGQNVSHYIEDAALAHVSGRPVRDAEEGGGVMALPSRLKNNDDLYQPLADINVTPLVDVMLVLLIIFMITAPLLAKGVKVNLPQAKAAQPLNQKDPIIVTIGKDGKISLGSDATTIEALVDGVRTLMGDDLTRVVHVRGDNDAVYGEVVKVMDRLASNGITHIAIMTNSRKQADAAGSDPAATSAAPAVAGSLFRPGSSRRSRGCSTSGGEGEMTEVASFSELPGGAACWRAQLSAGQAALARPGRHGGGGARSCRPRRFSDDGGDRKSHAARIGDHGSGAGRRYVRVRTGGCDGRGRAARGDGAARSRHSLARGDDAGRDADSAQEGSRKEASRRRA